MGKLKQIVEFSPAWNRQSEGQGIGGVEIRFAVVGERGAVSFSVFTNWFLPEDERQVEAKVLETGALTLMRPFPALFAVHRAPNAGEELTAFCDCDLIGGPCTCDTSATRAVALFRLLVAEGSERVFDELSALYAANFEEEKQE
jgi:hypothetical protein